MPRVDIFLNRLFDRSVKKGTYVAATTAGNVHYRYVNNQHLILFASRISTVIF